MTSQRFNLLFRGDIVLGRNIVEVKQGLMKLFKADAAKVDGLFSGRPVVIKKNLPELEAKRYQKALLGAGAQVEIVGVKTVAVAEKAPPPPKQTLAERLAKEHPLTEVGARQERIPGQQAPVKATSRLEELASKSPEEAVSPLEGWKLAPIGSQMLDDAFIKDDEVEQVVPVDAELRPMQGNLLDESECVESVAPIGVDLSGLSLAETGADMLSEDERPLPIVEVALEIEFEVAPVGSMMADEKPEVAPLTFDFSAIELTKNQ